MEKFSRIQKEQDKQEIVPRIIYQIWSLAKFFTKNCCLFFSSPSLLFSRLIYSFCFFTLISAFDDLYYPCFYSCIFVIFFFQKRKIPWALFLPKTWTLAQDKLARTRLFLAFLFLYWSWEVCPEGCPQKPLGYKKIPQNWYAFRAFSHNNDRKSGNFWYHLNNTLLVITFLPLVCVRVCTIVQ